MRAALPTKDGALLAEEAAVLRRLSFHLLNRLARLAQSQHRDAVITGAEMVHLVL